MHQLLTPLLRRVYVVAALIVAVYFSAPPILRSSWNKERLYRQMLSGEKEAKARAAASLAAYGGEAHLLRALRSDSASVREAAMSALADHWFNAGSEDERQMLHHALEWAGQREFKRALTTLTVLTRSFPGYAEGWSRRAVLFWQFGLYERALDDCRRVVMLNPDNFQAWQEMGLCHLRLGNLPAAARSLRVALQINPHDRQAQRFLRRCEDALRRANPPIAPGADMV